MVWRLLIVVYLAVLQCGSPVCAFLHSPIFRSWPALVKHVKHSAQLQRDVPLRIGSPLQKLKEVLGKGDCNSFKNIVRVIYEDTRHRALRKDEKDELRLMLPDFEKLDPRAPEIASVLRCLDGLLSARNKEDKFVLDSLIVKYLRSVSPSLRSFPLFLTSLKKLDYRWNFFGSDAKERILNMFDDMSNDNVLKGREYSEIIAGITGLGMKWNDLKERTRETLLGRLKNIHGGCDLVSLYSIIFNLGKLSVRIHHGDVIRETVLQMTSKIFELMEKESIQKKRERIVSVSECFIITVFEFLSLLITQISNLIKGLSGLGFQKEDFSKEIQRKLINKTVTCWNRMGTYEKTMTLIG
jgi:hypothetical protein